MIRNHNPWNMARAGIWGILFMVALLAPVFADDSGAVELELGGGATMRFVPIDAGAFPMGSPKSEEGHEDDEGQHEVRIDKAFYLSAYAVTQAQYEAIMGSNPSHFRGADRPVEQVSWNDAMLFCQKVSEKTGRNVHLPTEAEWEYACRAGTATPFSTGETIQTDQANYDGNKTYGPDRKGESRGETVPAGHFPPNAWGLHEMHGNLWEWCSDWYGPYPEGPAINPAGPANGGARVIRGGSWIRPPRRAVPPSVTKPLPATRAVASASASPWIECTTFHNLFAGS